MPDEGPRAARAERQARHRSSAAAWPGSSPRSSCAGQGHEPLVLEAQHRVGGRVYTLPRLRAGPVRRGRRDAHPARPRPDAGLLRAVRPADAAVRDGQSRTTLVFIGGQRMTVAEADAQPGPAAVRPGRRTSRAGPWTQLWNEATSRLPRRSTSRAARQAWTRCSQRVRPVLDPRVPESAASREGAHRVLRRHELPRGELNAAVVEQLREIVGQVVRGHAGDRRRHGPAARRVLRASSSRTSASAPRSRRSSRTPDVGHGALQDRGRAASASRGDYAICAIPFSVLRDDRVLSTPFSREKQKAIRQLNYNASTKILFQVAAPLLGEGGRHRRRHDRHRPADPAHLSTRRSPTRTTSAACCSRRTRGARTRCAGARWTRRR